MKKIADILTNYIIKQNAISRDEYVIYNYGFRVALEAATCFFSCLIIAAYMNQVNNYVIFLLIFFPLRSFVGGIHMKHFASCYILSCIVVWGVLALSAIINLPTITITSMAFIETLVLLIIAPVDNKNRPISCDEFIIFSKKTKVILANILLGIVILYILKQYELIITAMLTLFSIIVSLICGKIQNYIYSFNIENKG